MKVIKHILSLLAFVSCTCVGARVYDADTINRPWKKYIDLHRYSEPFWTVDTIVDETVQVIRDNDTVAYASLLFKATKILSVKAADYTREYAEGKDWDYAKGQLVFGTNSGVPFFRKKDLVVHSAIQGSTLPGKKPGTFVLFSEGAYFSARQLVVTYIKDKHSTWEGPVPIFARDHLPNAIAKLTDHHALNIVFYGNSIEVGYNASGFEQVPPFMPAWPELVVYNLRARCQADVTYSNQSIAGKTAKWGMDSVQRVVSRHPDLVIIGFGMNDGTGRVPPAVYREEIRAIMDSVTAHNPTAEFILIAPMLANPAYSFDGFQRLYKPELDKLTRRGVAIADMTGVHAALLKRKTYQDMTGNNINHPNDYLARWYAQYITGILSQFICGYSGQLARWTLLSIK